MIKSSKNWKNYSFKCLTFYLLISKWVICSRIEKRERLIGVYLEFWQLKGVNLMFLRCRCHCRCDCGNSLIYRCCCRNIFVSKEKHFKGKYTRVYTSHKGLLINSCKNLSIDVELGWSLSLMLKMSLIYNVPENNLAPFSPISSIFT